MNAGLHFLSLHYMLIARISYDPLFLFSFAETGQALVSSVDKIIFVGSPGVGRMV
jgi:hypothetical protein